MVQEVVGSNPISHPKLNIWAKFDLRLPSCDRPVKSLCRGAIRMLLAAGQVDKSPAAPKVVGHPKNAAFGARTGEHACLSAAFCGI